MSRSVKQARVDVLPHKSLRHANSRDRFRDGRRHAAPTLLHLAVRVAERAAKTVIHHGQHRRHGQHDEKQHLVVPQHQQRRKKHLSRLDCRDEKHVLPANPHRFGIGRVTADDAPDLRPIVETHRHPQQMLENVVPQILEDRFAQLQRQPLAKVEAELRHRRE